MPHFKNTSANTLRFRIRDELFEVPPDHQCEISKQFVYVIKARGYPLEPATPDLAVAVESTPAPPPRMVLQPGVENDDTPDSHDDALDESAESPPESAAGAAIATTAARLPRRR